MLTDTGPLIALLDENDQHHAACVTVVRNLPNEPLITTWLCFTEAIYFLGDEGGYRFQERLWKLRRDGTLVLLDLTDSEGDRMDALMAKYQNVPMDAADASMVTVAESRNYRRLFTIDGDFIFSDWRTVPIWRLFLEMTSLSNKAVLFARIETRV